MTTKQIKRWMNLGGAAALCAAAAVLAWGFLLPLHVPASASSAARPVAQNAGSSNLSPAQRGPSLDVLQSAAAIDLRQPLRDPPPPIITPPPMQARFVGTIYQANDIDNSLAIFRFPDNSERLFKAGQQFNDPAGQVTIKRVGDQAVVIELQGKEQELGVAAQ